MATKAILRGAGAIVAGIATTVVLSYGTDAVFGAAGMIPKGKLPMYGSEIAIASIVAYRTVFTALGCYVTAKLAPSHPMRYALGLGVFGFLGSIGGALASGSMALGPTWYGWSLVILTLPAAWLGGELAQKRGPKEMAS